MTAERPADAADDHDEVPDGEEPDDAAAQPPRWWSRQR